MNQTRQTLVQGDVLSCYTASIATYMEGLGIDYRLAIGTQLFLALQQIGENPSFLRFIHYHTPLLGETPTHTLSLTLNHTTDPVVAREALRIQHEKFGASIVPGDAMYLPWSVAYGRKHLPHWFVVASVDERLQSLLILDPFEAMNDEGTQQPFAGCIRYRHFSDIFRVNSVYDQVLQSRNDLAFGREKKLPNEAFTSYQWFSADHVPQAKDATQELKLELLRRTLEFHTGKRARADLAADGWICGLEALNALKDFFSAHAKQAIIYTHSDDIWVAMRQRQLFLEVFFAIGKALQFPDLASFMDWGWQEYLPQWQILPRILRYNFFRLQRKKEITPSVLTDALEKVAEKEAKLMEYLDKSLPKT